MASAAFLCTDRFHQSLMANPNGKAGPDRSALDWEFGGWSKERIEQPNERS